MQKRIPLEDVVPNPDQPRKTFTKLELDELAASIDQNGLIQPITVTPRDDKFMIVAGERRWRAHCALAKDGHVNDILCIVKKMDDTTVALHALCENMCRQDMTPLEEANAFQAMLERGMTVEELATKLGIRQSFRIKDRLQLLQLTPEIQTLVKGGQLNAASAYEIAKLDTGGQTRMVQKISSGRLVTLGAIKAAVQTQTDVDENVCMFGDLQDVSTADRQALGSMERRVEQVISMINAGWKDGECIIAMKVDRDRAVLMAERLELAQKAVAAMARSLREAHGQVEMLTETAA